MIDAYDEEKKEEEKCPLNIRVVYIYMYTKPRIEGG